MSKFLKQSNPIRDERLDLLERLQEQREQLLNVLVPLIVSTGIRDKNLQTILKQYSVLKDTIISTVENVDAVKQYIIRWDDDEDEAVDLGLTRTNFRNKKTSLLRATT